jgi:sarcosine oxidase
MTVTADVAVVGMGAMGAAALYQLARRGANVVGIDRYAPPHTFGSTHGETRITRQAVGEGAIYAPLVLRSHQIWRELEAATGASLLTACGGIMVGSPGSSHHQRVDFVRGSAAVARQFGIAHEVLDRAEILHRFPWFTGLAEDDAGYYEPGAGFVRPEACITAQLSQATGARIMTGTQVTAITQIGDTVRLETTAGAIEAARVIVSAGAWTAPLLGAPFDRLLRVTRQVLHWFAPDDPAPFQADRCPIFIRMHGAGDSDYFYGFPIPKGGEGVKVAGERYEIETHADTVDRTVTPDEAAAFHAHHIAGRMAGVSARVLKSISCLYTNTSDAGFLIDTHPSMPAVTVVSACSGHGFKHSAAIGEALAERATTGRSTIDLSPFALARLTPLADPPVDR